MRLGWVATASGDGQLAEGPQAIHLLDQELLQPPSVGVLEDLREMSQGSHHPAAVERLAVLACVGVVLVEGPGLLRAAVGVEIPFAHGVHILIPTSLGWLLLMRGWVTS